MVTALEKIALKIGSQSISQYRDIQFIANVAELSNLLLGQKLSFIDEHTMHNLLGMFLLHATE